MPLDLGQFTDFDYCYLTTAGRVTSRPHTIEIWFAVNGQTLYLLSGGGKKSDWVRNLQHTPEVSVRLNHAYFTGSARIVEDRNEEALARRIVVAKYTPRYKGDLSEWGRTALPVAIDLLSLRRLE